MNRKAFLHNISIGTIGTILLPSLSYPVHFKSSEPNGEITDWLKTEQSGDDYNTVIKCDHLTKDIKIIHISDSHLTILKNGKSEYPDFAERMNKAYLNPKHYLTGNIGTRSGHFEEILSKAKKEKVDLLLLTGDILNNPSIYGVDYLVEKLKNCGINYLYIAGNHDWHFEGMKGSRDSLRNEWIQNRLLPLYQGNNPLYYSKIINGINFVMIDDSTYQINEEQLRFFREQVDRNYPIILSMHIPIYQPEDLKNNLFGIGDPRWGYNYDQESYMLERRERWPKEGNKKETLEFVIEVLACKKLLAVFVGHKHSASSRKISPSAYMYRTKASYSAAHRYVVIKKSNE
ncbi:MAG: metallophosphoesterase [Bacteroidota bacterium]